MEQLRDKIRRIRKERGLEQQFVAKKAGISPAALSDIERGRRNPSTETAQALAQAFEMTVDELLKDVVMYVYDKPWKVVPENEYLDMILED
jgi:transcriptional regulator with XRE-family HTH domain